VAELAVGERRASARDRGSLIVWRVRARRRSRRTYTAPRRRVVRKPSTFATAPRLSRTERMLRRRLFALAFVLGVLILAPALASSQTADSVIVAWTAPGDDGNKGTATVYDLRWSYTPISDDNFDLATPVEEGVPQPLKSGTQQRVVLHGLSRGRPYYFAIRSVDNRGNWSALSNIVKWDWSLDASPPLPPRHVRATKESDGVLVQWDANTEGDLAGYNLYRTVDAASTERVNDALITETSYVDADVPSDAQTVSYELTAVDARGNESAQAAPSQVAITTLAAWKLMTGYPNPSRLGQSVRLPVVIPTNGHGDAELQIVDSGGHVVRRLYLSNPAPGTTELVWDGTNDAGRPTVPGVYRAWLISGNTRLGARLLRVP